MSFVAAAAAVIPSIFSAITSMGQRRQAKRIRANAVDPGFQMNSGVMQNRDILANRYGNYTLPGMSQQMNRIGTNAATALNAGMRGATSGADVLDLATKIAYGTGQQQNQLMLQEAQGREGALNDFLGANVAAGQERQNANAWDRQLYERKLDEAAALQGASMQNMSNAVTGASSIGTAMLMNPVTPTTTYNSRAPQIYRRAQMAGINTNQNPYTTPLIPM